MYVCIMYVCMGSKPDVIKYKPEQIPLMDKECNILFFFYEL